MKAAHHAVVLICLISSCWLSSGCSFTEKPSVNILFTAGNQGQSFRSFVVRMKEGDVYEGFKLVRIIDSTIVLITFDRIPGCLNSDVVDASPKDSIVITLDDLRILPSIIGVNYRHTWARVDTTMYVDEYFTSNDDSPVLEIVDCDRPHLRTVVLKEHHRDGSLNTEVRLYNDCPSGELIVIHKREWAENGQLVYKRTMDPESQSGHLTQWYENGVKYMGGTLGDGLHEGEWSVWDEWGVLRQRGYYERGKKSGPWTYWDTSGRECGRAEFVDGEGRLEMWHANGKPMVEGLFVDYGQQSYWYKGWYETGLKQVPYSGILDGIRDGVWREWYESGQLKSSRSYTCGKKVEEHVWYKPDGEVELSMNENYLIPEFDWYANGQWKHSYGWWDWTEWDEHGTKRISIQRNTRTKHGSHVESYADGTIKLEGQWSNGRRCGTWIHYWPNGDRRLELTYDLECDTIYTAPKNHFGSDPKSVASVYRRDGTMRFSEAHGEADSIQRLYYDESGHPENRETYHRGKLVFINGEHPMR